jgi:hypothetical protein
MPAQPFQFKTVPFPIQRATVKDTWARRSFGQLWQQRTGKSKVVLDSFALGALNGKVDTLVITAPAGVHIGWIDEQVPQHLAVEASTWLWDSRKALAARKREEAGEGNAYTAALKRWLSEPGFKVFAHNIDSVRTSYGAKVLKYVLTHSNAMWAVDEADDLTDPTSDRSTTILSLRDYAVQRRVLSGTLATGGPFAFYASMAFLEADFWQQHGYRLSNVTLFQKYFAEFEARDVRAKDGNTRGIFVVAKDAFGKKKYRHFAVFRKLVDPHVSRVLQADMYPHFAALQKPVISTEYFALSDTQRHHYRELQREYVTSAPSGASVDGGNPAVRQMRLHQIACGYVRPRADEPTERLPGPNPRLDALLRAVRKLGDDEKGVVWTAFEMDQVLVAECLTANGFTCGRYDGATLGTRERDKGRFTHEAEPRLLVGNVQALSRGHDLTRGNHEIFYSYPYRLLYFSQAAERLKGPNQRRPIFRTWIVAHGTVDEKIRRAYQNDQEIADALTGDPATDILGLETLHATS